MFCACSAGVQHVGPDGQPLAWYEWIYANPGEVVRMNEPEFVISVPQHAVPCEVCWSLISPLDLQRFGAFGGADGIISQTSVR